MILSRLVAVRPVKPILALVVAAVATAAAAAVLTPSAQAASCGSRALASPFSKAGDSNQYFLAPSGSFEAGASGWSLSSASVVAGNETSYLNGSADEQSLRLTGSGSATSPAFCITRDDPQLRFVTRTATATGSTGNYSQLNVSINVQNSAGSQANFFLGTVTPTGFSNWSFSQQFSYGKLLDSWLFGANGSGTAMMRVQFTVAGQGGNWFVDDVFVDPFCGR